MNMHTMEFIRVINIGIILFIGMWTVITQFVAGSDG
jgi:hypothetical protein